MMGFTKGSPPYHFTLTKEICRLRPSEDAKGSGFSHMRSPAYATATAMTDRLQFAQLTSLICEMLYFEGY